ncbi:MAG: N utilization substance protein B [Kiritimatiellia bacterium]|jgi:transcription antitermination protein NusB
MSKSRHTARERAIQLLFQLDYNESDELEITFDEFWGSFEDKPDVRPFADSLIHGVMEHRNDLDKEIQRYAKNWDLDRMGGVDRNVLRLAIYEIKHRKDIPPVVSVNEAIELARELSSDEASKFVNGILDRAIKDTDRPLRTPTK